MTASAKMVVTDTEAIALYVAAGNPREDWDRFEAGNALWAAAFATNPRRS